MQEIRGMDPVTTSYSKRLIVNKGYITRQDHVTTVIFSPDGTTIASAIDEKTIRL